MASEKHVQFSVEPDVEQSGTKSPKRRRSLIATLGGVALLATGFASGMGMTMYCNTEQYARRGSADVASYADLPPMSPISPQSPSRRSFHNLDASSKSSTKEHAKRASVWQPEPGLTWNYQLSMVPTPAQLANPKEFDVWNIDLFDTPATSIKTIQNAGSKVICYFSGGTYEEWRPDALKFKAADKGKEMADWEGETWVKTSSSNVRKIMAARLDMAKAKGCDGVDPDNIDGYNHDTGFGLTQADSTNFIKYLSTEAAKRGLALGLKNSGEIIPSVLDNVQFSVNEQCAQYNECDIYKPFIAEGKPVFHVEYPKGDDVNNTKKVSATKSKKICGCLADNFSPIIKNNNLNSWIQKC